MAQYAGDATMMRRDDAGATEPEVVVGLGASAGGITALREFFSHTAATSGAAYVVILHLSPDHDSQLAQVLQSATAMPVAQVRDRVTLRRDHVYVIPPNGTLAIVGWDLVVSDMTGAEQRRAPVDMFFRSLGDVHGNRAVAVVLSGTGPNGSSGIKRVKEHGGLCLAQDPAEAEHADMPRNTIGTGLVDLVLPIARMPSAIAEYMARLGTTDHEAPRAGTDDSEALREIMTLLRVRTGHDFSNYKPATLRRRIERRINVTNQPSLTAYAAALREQGEEAHALMRELLISVTNFFRDPDAYAVLERRVVPRIFELRNGQQQVRAWVAGCATGEEAYSVAMLLAECAATTPDPPAIQVFASDIDARAIAIAREGIYSSSDVADVPEERLRRFFQPVGRGFRVGRELRDLVLFANHNVIRDPPFSHLDLIACRNVLIYLNRSVQERVLETFHFALRAGGFLFLGASESAESTAELFAPLDKAAHLYASRTVTTRVALPQPTVGSVASPRPPAPGGEARTAERIWPAELHHRLLDEYAAPSMVVNHEYQVLHVSSRAARFLEVAGGEPSRDLLKLAIPELRVDLRTALYEATQHRTSVDISGIRLSAEHGGGAVRLVVRPVLMAGEPSRGYFLVLFEPDAGKIPDDDPPVHFTSPTDAPVTQLEEELGRVKAQLRATIEQYESQVEEARSSNEELQAMNEELRSAAEELETSKEELQSVNEELTTVNQELKIKIEELGLTNNDFKNFINATDIATIFLDRGLRVKLATARAREVFNLLPADIGRKLSDITSALMYDQVEADVEQVLETLERCERELPTRTGRWYMMRILPYRTTEDRIDGVVMTFIDVTNRRAMEARAAAGEERLRLLVESATDYAIFTMTAAGDIDSWNTGAQRMFGYSTAEVLGRSGIILFTPEDRESGAFEQELATARRDGRARDERHHLRSDGS